MGGTNAPVSKTIIAAMLALHVGGTTESWHARGAQAAVKSQAAAEHVIVYAEKGKFCGFPANNGAWSWGDEILVAFKLDNYRENQKGHSIGRGPTETVQVRSLDGGSTWALEKPRGLQAAGEPQPFRGRLDFLDPNFSLRCGSRAFQFSFDRGRTWSEYYALPKVGEQRLMCRTDYVVNSSDDCLLFLAAAKTNGKEGRPFCARTTDGGRTIEFVSWMSPEPDGFSIMPSTLRTGGNELLSAIRRKEKGQGFVEIYASNDEGRSWRLLGAPAHMGRNNGNPPSMVAMKDGRIVLTYGYRSQPMGIRARISRDGGRTWGTEIHLRDDARTWDMGYPRTRVRSDGKLVTVYYFTTIENPEQHIAATIWSPE